ncbi:Retrovirus-related Pol polyprotein from transposon 17.6-like protein [Drosera capensis]
MVHRPLWVKLTPSKLTSIHLEDRLSNSIWTLRIVVMSFKLTNAPTMFTDLMSQVFKLYIDKFMVVFINDILIYSTTKEEHKAHLCITLETLRTNQLYAKFKKYEFWLKEVVFLGDLISDEGLKVNP